MVALPSVSPTTLGKGGCFAEWLMATLGKGREALPSALLVALGKASLPLLGAMAIALGKDSVPLPSAMTIALSELPSFVECLGDCTRHSWEICFFAFFLFIASTHTYITQPSHIYHISHNNHIYHTAITYNP